MTFIRASTLAEILTISTRADTSGAVAQKLKAAPLADYAELGAYIADVAISELHRPFSGKFSLKNHSPSNMGGNYGSTDLVDQTLMYTFLGADLNVDNPEVVQLAQSFANHYEELEEVTSKAVSGVVFYDSRVCTSHEVRGFVDLLSQFDDRLEPSYTVDVVGVEMPHQLYIDKKRDGELPSKYDPTPRTEYADSISKAV